MPAPLATMNPLALFRGMRPHQWVKNVFVLAAVLFARGEEAVERQAQGLPAPAESDWSDLTRSLLAFLAFCLGASAVYLLNDVMDVEKDRRHPTKCLRPVASGELSAPMALVFSALLAAGALGLGHQATGSGSSVALVVLAYMGVNLAYSLKLKQVVILDAFCIAVGFILRVKAGGFAADYYVSHWLTLCTFFLALFLALCKRRAELDLLGEEGGNTRVNLREYTVGFLDQMITVLAATTILCYTMYTVAPETAEKFDVDDGGNRLVYSVPFVVFGLARYMLLVETSRGGASPTRVLLGGDAMFVINALAWLGVISAALFGYI